MDTAVIQRVEEALKLHQPLELLIPQAPSDTSATRNLHLSVTPVFNADGSLRHSLGKLRDIDLDRRASEEALANKLRLEFFNTLSHELKTPLKCVLSTRTGVHANVAPQRYHWRLHTCDAFAANDDRCDSVGGHARSPRDGAQLC